MSTQENALAAKLGGAKISDEELERRLATADQKIAGASLGFTDWAGADPTSGSEIGSNGYWWQSNHTDQGEVPHHIRV